MQTIINVLGIIFYVCLYAYIFCTIAILALTYPLRKKRKLLREYSKYLKFDTDLEYFIVDFLSGKLGAKIIVIIALIPFVNIGMLMILVHLWWFIWKQEKIQTK